MVLRDVLNGSLEKWCESVELECVWRCVFVADSDAKNGSVETGNDRLFPCARVDTKTKIDGRHERSGARASFAHDWMNADTQQEFFTALESQFCQALRGNNGMTAGQKLLESEHMDCRRAGVVQTTSCVRMAVVASMAPKAPMAWMDLVALELKSEREKVQWFGEHLLRPTLRIKPFVLLFFRCPLGTVLLMSLHSAATPRENDGSRSLRRVKIGGMRAEGSCETGGERAEGLPCKIKNC